MKLKKGFIQPVMVATMGIFSAMSLGGAGYTMEAYAPDQLIVNQIIEEKAEEDLARGIVDGLTRKERADRIDAYFEQWDLPLAGHGMTFVTEADKYPSVDWKLVAAIGMRESTGCKFAFAKNNCFGWGRKVTFATIDQAIVDITRHLAGENEKTAHHYAGKDTKGILAKYNSVIPDYTKEIFAIMSDIETIEVNHKDSKLAMNK